MVIDPCVLTEPCWLEEYLVDQRIADTDWSTHLPDPVLDVIEAMYERLDRDWCPRDEALALIARHFAATIAIHAEAVERNGESIPTPVSLDGDPDPRPPMGGSWEPTSEAVALALEARGRRERRHITRPAAIARQRLPEDQPVLFDLTEAS